MKRSHLIPGIAAMTTVVALSACQNNRRSAERVYVERPVEQLYAAGAEEMDKRDYLSAIQLFNEVERQHPYSEWARRASLMSAFASYESGKYTDTITTAQRYVSLHPGSEDAPYAYYLIALSYFDQIMDVGRDQKITEDAKVALQDIVRRFPDSEYAKDANLKMDMVNDQLAGKEMTIGRWYLRRGQPLPAINRFRTVVETYQTTSHTEEALHRLVEGYLSVGLKGEALAAAAVLGYNYPQSEWYQRSYSLMTNEGLNPDAVTDEDRKGFISRLFGRG